ncbi:hypothetical protein D3C78_1243570 [compost metagenome]
MTIKLAYDNSCFNGEVLAKIVTDQFSSALLIHDTYECVGYLSKVLAALLSFIDRNAECDFICISWNLCKVNLYLLIIAIALACTVVACMSNGAVSILRVVVENEIRFTVRFALCVQAEHGCVKVKVLAAVIFICIPAKSYRNFRKTRICFRKIDFLSFG